MCTSMALERLRAVENAALRVASSRRNGVITDTKVLDALDAALESPTSIDATGPAFPHIVGVNWTRSDEQRAELEGWCFSERDDTGVLNIEKTDCSDDDGAAELADDDAAFDLVNRHASSGSLFHIRALEIYRSFDARRAQVEAEFDALEVDELADQRAALNSDPGI